MLSSVAEDTAEVSLPTLDGDFYLDFGTDNKLVEPVSMCLKVTNTSAIPTSLETVISHFPAAKVSGPPPQQGMCMLC